MSIDNQDFAEYRAILQKIQDVILRNYLSE